MSERYIVTEPVPAGFSWWRVADTFTKEQGNPMGQNFEVADFFRDMPNAEQEARALCRRLNDARSKTEASGNTVARQQTPSTAASEPADNLFAELRRQYDKAVAKHAPFNSPHEGWAVIREELDELWDEVRAWQPDDHREEQLRKEAFHVGAMAIRFLADVCKVPIGAREKKNGPSGEALNEALELFLNERDTELDMMRCDYAHGTPENIAWHKGVEEAWKRFDVVKAAVRARLATSQSTHTTEKIGEGDLQMDKALREALEKVLPCIFGDDRTHDWDCTNCVKRKEILALASTH